MSNLLTRPLAPAFTSYIVGCRIKLSWARFFRHLFGLISILCLSSLSFFLISNYIVQSVTVSGPSMIPNLLNGGNYFVNRLAYVQSEPKATDIVEVRDPQDGSLVVKRIIATPGESVYFKKGVVYVNGKRIFEPYLESRTPTFAYEKSSEEFTCCGADQYFVLGDNRNNSTDSRTFGPVPRSNILGKLMQ